MIKCFNDKVGTATVARFSFLTQTERREQIPKTECLRFISYSSSLADLYLLFASKCDTSKGDKSSAVAALRNGGSP